MMLNFIIIQLNLHFIKLNLYQIYNNIKTCLSNRFQLFKTVIFSCSVRHFYKNKNLLFVPPGTLRKNTPVFPLKPGKEGRFDGCRGRICDDASLCTQDPATTYFSKGRFVNGFNFLPLLVVSLRQNGTDHILIHF